MACFRQHLHGRASSLGRCEEVEVRRTRHEQRDARRDAFLASKGLRVLRFSNHDVMTNRAGVLETIAAAIEHAPSLTLPRKRGRGR